MKTLDKLQQILISKNTRVKEAMKQMDAAGEKILFVADEGQRLVGSLTDGDIRRWILSDGKLDAEIEKVYNHHPIFLAQEYQLEEARQLMLAHKIQCLPVVNGKKEIVNILTWDTAFKENFRPHHETLQASVVIMAGGKGTRLDPFTRILPKALIPIENKPVLEVIMDRFAEFNRRNFTVILGYKSEMIVSYFDNAGCDYELEYIKESSPLGTAGGLKLLPKGITGDFFVTNCDIIIKTDYADLLRFHQSEKNDITMVGAVRHYAIPYGVAELNGGSQLAKLVEKPEFDFVVNTGMYVLNQKALNFIPAGQPMDFNILINLIQKSGGRVGVYPVTEKSWIDIGQWEEYKNSMKNFSLE